MFKISNNEFTLLNNLIENIPRKDYFYKDKIRVVFNLIIELILKLNYDEDNISFIITNIKGDIAYFDFLLDRLFILKYIRGKNLCSIGEKLIEINKMVTKWINNKYESIN